MEEVKRVALKLTSVQLDVIRGDPVVSITQLTLV
jgi:hypothetical protein